MPIIGIYANHEYVMCIIANTAGISDQALLLQSAQPEAGPGIAAPRRTTWFQRVIRILIIAFEDTPCLSHTIAQKRVQTQTHPFAHK